MAAVATLFGTNMALITGNSGGAIESLPQASLVGGKQRFHIERLVLAAQASGSVIGVARVRLPFVLADIYYLTDTSLGTTTIALGDYNATAAYHAAQTLTSINQMVRPTGLVTATFATPITAGYDCVNGGADTPLAPGQGGAAYEDFVLTTAVAALPGAGNLCIFLEVAYE